METEVALIIPEANEKLILQQYGEDEEDNPLSCHRKQVLPYKIPLERIQSLFGAWRRKKRKKTFLEKLNISVILCV